MRRLTPYQVARRLTKPVQCTSPAQSPGVTDEDTCSNANEEDEIARYVDATVFGAITSGTNLTLTDVQAAIAKGCDC